MSRMLRFDLGPIPVSVHFSFLVIAFLGPGSQLWEIAVWTVAVFFAVLAHEAGHAFTARAYGAHPVNISLFALGGVTTYPASIAMSPKRRFLISAAGSAVGIVLGGIVAIVWLVGGFDGASDLVRLAAVSFIWAGLGWGVLNWIPIGPLDGGQMLTSAMQIALPQTGAAIARVISIAVGIAIVVGSVALEVVTPTNSGALQWANGFNWGFVAIFVAFLTFIGARGNAAEPPDPRQGDESSEQRSEVANDPGRAATDVPTTEPEPPQPPTFPI